MAKTIAIRCSKKLGLVGAAAGGLALLSVSPAGAQSAPAQATMNGAVSPGPSQPAGAVRVDGQTSATTNTAPGTATYPPRAYPAGYQPNYPPPLGVQPIPMRYDLEPRYGFIIGGAVLGAATYVSFSAFTFFGDLISEVNQVDWPMWIPLIGPFIELYQASANSLVPYAVADGVLQTAGLGLIIVGAVARKRVPLFTQNMMILPYVTPTSRGLAAMGTF